MLQDDAIHAFPLNVAHSETILLGDGVGRKGGGQVNELRTHEGAERRFSNDPAFDLQAHLQWRYRSNLTSTFFVKSTKIDESVFTEFTKPHQLSYVPQHFLYVLLNSDNIGVFSRKLGLVLQKGAF